MEYFWGRRNGDGESNAFKHAYWNATASSKIGEKKTRLFANAHEFGWAWENAADATPMKMDLHNNEAGRKVGSSNLYSGDIETGILSYLMSGRLWKIENGQLVKTNGNARF
ncbi:MAG: wnt family protein [Lachnospiraceae bacterium]|nr:wnt family protein [Lachnospiraceae bacterium]